MSSFLTPDVYTEEVSTLPPSVAAVSTAIPAFLGYTEKAVKDGKTVTNIPVRITTLLEYKEYFGGAQPTQFNVTIDAGDAVLGVTSESLSSKLYYALDHYFKNGGGACYIISLGSYDKTVSKADFLNGLEALRKEDEPTLIMLGEATVLSESDYYSVCQQALSQCADLKDRFCVFDILDHGQGVQNFRDQIGTNYLKYGAAYTPYLYTSLNYVVDDANVSVTTSSSAEMLFAIDNHADNGLRISYSGQAEDSPRFKVVANTGGDITFLIAGTDLTIQNVGSEGADPQAVIDAWDLLEDKQGFEITSVAVGEELVTNTSNTFVAIPPATTGSIETTLADLKEAQSALYNAIKTEVAKKRVTLPPSAAVAGAYAATDRDRGVWKAPANISLNAVIAPTQKITSAEQELLNVDSTAGKSVNAIRSFSGKGTLVWGARTLAGNDNEWRYVPVRRLFNMIEEATKKASYFAVFEPNTAATWLKVKAMIDSYLYGLWQQGAFAGATAEQAYFVNIGLGKTMTQQDILEGRMIVEIGVAAVRPAEFIILRFSHKLQES